MNKLNSIPANKRLTKVSETQMLTGGLEYFVVTTGTSIVPDVLTDASTVAVRKIARARDRMWEQIIEIFRTRANVVIVGPLSADGFSLAVEHTGAIDVTDADFLAALAAIDDSEADVTGFVAVAVPATFNLVV